MEDEETCLTEVDHQVPVWQARVKADTLVNLGDSFREREEIA